MVIFQLHKTFCQLLGVIFSCYLYSLNYFLKTLDMFLRDLQFLSHLDCQGIFRWCHDSRNKLWSCHRRKSERLKVFKSLEYCCGLRVIGLFLLFNSLEWLLVEQLESRLLEWLLVALEGHWLAHRVIALVREETLLRIVLLLLILLIVLPLILLWREEGAIIVRLAISIRTILARLIVVVLIKSVVVVILLTHALKFLINY